MEADADTARVDMVVCTPVDVFLRHGAVQPLVPAPWPRVDHPMQPGRLVHPEPLALSPDGTRVLLAPEAGRLSTMDVTGAARTNLTRLTRDGLEYVPRRGCFAPDGRDVAVFSVRGIPRTGGGDQLLEVAVHVHTLDGGAHRLVWAIPGGWGQESAIAWSSDGEQLAITWWDYDEDTDLDIWVTSVVGLDGVERHRMHDRRLLPGNDSAWTAGGTLYLEDQECGRSWTLPGHAPTDDSHLLHRVPSHGQQRGCGWRARPETRSTGSSSSIQPAGPSGTWPRCHLTHGPGTSWSPRRSPADRSTPADSRRAPPRRHEPPTARGGAGPATGRRSSSGSVCLAPRQPLAR